MWGQPVCALGSFFTPLKCSPAAQIISLTELQHRHRHVGPIQLLRRRADTWGKSKKRGFTLESVRRDAQLPGSQRRRNLRGSGSPTRTAQLLVARSKKGASSKVGHSLKTQLYFLLVKVSVRMTPTRRVQSRCKHVIEKHRHLVNWRRKGGTRRIIHRASYHTRSSFSVCCDFYALFGG